MSAEMPKMPEPFGYVSDDKSGGYMRFQHAPFDEMHMLVHSTMQVYTAADLEQVRQEAARQAMELAVVCKYLPPDGIDAKEALSRIIAIVDPWPLGGNERGR